MISKAILGTRIALSLRQAVYGQPKAEHQRHGHENPQVQGHIGGLVVTASESIPAVALDRRATSLGTTHLAVTIGFGNSVLPVAHDTCASGYRTNSLRRQRMHTRIRRKSKPHPCHAGENGANDGDSHKPLSPCLSPLQTVHFARIRFHRSSFPRRKEPQARACGSSKGGLHSRR